ncbi:hypothetical protein [Streptomyces sp. KR55]|uniref:hypothetical protein n=1 Tax=Streptomyces sp. KR55 TaxID=3457425 RepID=UPI003FCF7603
MPLGAPQGPTQSQWTIAAASIALVGEYPVAFNIAAMADNPDAPGVAETVQKFVDLIAASSDFKVNIATRTYSYSERMTPTA